MTERFTYIGSSYVFLIKDGRILLQRRYNTGVMYGHYGVPAGHLDGGETAREGAVRECKEEIGIDINPADLRVVHVMHRKAECDERIDFFMTVDRYEGTIENREPHKCDELGWFPIDDLPDNTIDLMRAAITSFQNNEFYSEYGWQ